MIREFSEKCPCRNCEQRSAECHSNCERYREWKAELDKAVKNLRDEKDVANYDAHMAITNRRTKIQYIWKR